MRTTELRLTYCVIEFIQSEDKLKLRLLKGCLLSCDRSMKQNILYIHNNK